jgi:NAD(P)-dependent dehydrogenase (short-subunit alcohol dehydrogenase family)
MLSLWSFGLLFITSPLIDKRNNVPYNVYGMRFHLVILAHYSAIDHNLVQKEIIMQDKPVALITGANQGIGLQIAKDLAAHGFYVLVGSRNLEKGEIAAQSIGEVAQAVQIDVTDQASINAAAERIRKEQGRLDVLINNAAISSTNMQSGTSVEEYARLTRPSNVSLAEMRAVWETNVFGVLAVTQALLPLLREAPTARIINVSSGVGSLTRNSDPTYPYRSIFGPVYPASKTALNAITVALAIELEAEGIKVNAVSPGFTKTNLNNYTGTETVEEGASEVVRLALLGPEGPTGTFTHAKLGTLPW